MPIATTNPATGTVEKTFDEMTDDEVERILARAATTFATYRTTTFAERGAWMVRAPR
jgi:succinate-semialdehyde dehydrogenase/glutarate-semialdehyde dehydrogenase